MKIAILTLPLHTNYGGILRLEFDAIVSNPYCLSIMKFLTVSLLNNYTAGDSHRIEMKGDSLRSKKQ